MPQTFTTETPERIDSHHYTIRSSKGNRSYDLVFDEAPRRWICNCPDARDPKPENNYVGNGNPNCKHRRRLREYIANAKQAQQQQEAQAIEEAKAVIIASQQESRIKNLESYTIKMEAALGDACNVIQQQALEMELLKKQMEEQRALLERYMAYETVHIDAQEIVINTIRNASRSQETPKAKTQEVIELRNEQGRIVGCKAGKHEAIVSGRLADNCTCGGHQEKPCAGLRIIEKHLETAVLVK